MKCSKCSRPLTKPALTVKRNGTEMWVGPKCAASMFAKTPRVRVPKVSVAVEVDPRQMPLALEVA
jgi:ribosomal protein L37AE/L43A